MNCEIQQIFEYIDKLGMLPFAKHSDIIPFLRKRVETGKYDTRIRKPESVVSIISYEMAKKKEKN